MQTKPEWLIRIDKEKEEKKGKLDLKELELETIPSELLEMDWLYELYLNKNTISKIENLDNLQNLEVLYLSDNKISKIENLTGLKSLRILDLPFNKISKIENLGHLENLAGLSLASNHLTVIENLSGLQNLKNLYLWGNKISKIENLEHCTKIELLIISNNLLTEIQGLDALSNLKQLELYGNQINRISGIAAQKTSLRGLDLENNLVERIENLEGHKNLEELLLGKNKIKELRGLTENKFLTKLDLYENQISGSIEQLKHNRELRYLGLSNNKVTDITVLGNHIKLKELYLSQNQLKDIDVLRGLTALERLVLSNTGLTTLRPLLPLIKKGIPVKTIYGFQDTTPGIYIKDNDKLDIDKGFIEQGNDAIIQFYQLQQNKSSALDEIFLNEAKLILVGEGKVGKTSLRIKLINPHESLPGDDERTRGIDITDYNFQLRGNENYTAHVWDFGGQNIQYALHRFFMTENSLYILMTESRNERDKNFMYWFQNIDLFGGKDSPILVVMNLMYGERGANIDIASYASEFKKIVNNEILEVNLLNPEQDNGFQKLRTVIEQQLENLPHIRKPIFRCWLDVREALQAESKKSNYISIEKYQQICLDNGVEEPHFEIVGRYLHNLGILLWYHDKEFLRNKMILNPIWAISAIYKIIDDKKIQDSKGKFDSADIDRLWNDASYRFSKDELTSLLKVFKICFQRSDSKAYIVPALMEANPPAAAKEWDKTDATTITFEYTFMPKGIANQLTADLHQHILDEINNVWAYGVLLNYSEESKTSALVTENTYNRVVSISVKGIYSSRFMGIIIQELKNINNSYMGLKSEMKIPCNCEKCKAHTDPQLYTEKDLLEKLGEGKTTVYCKRLDEKINMQPILESIGITHPLFEKLKNKGTNEETQPPVKGDNNNKKVFISYSHAQADYIKIFSTDFRTYLKMPGMSFEVFDDFQIPVGSLWDDHLADKVSTCDIMVLLVSEEFMNSSYIRRKEFGEAVSRLNTKNDILIMPVYFAPCNFDDEHDLSQLQFFKPDGSDYGLANLGKRFSYTDLVTFRATDGMPTPNPNRQRYMLDFVNKLKLRL